MLDFLQLRMESARTAKMMEKFSGLNVVNMNVLFLAWDGWLRKLTLISVEIGYGGRQSRS